MAIATLQNAIKQVQKAMENKILRDLSSMVNKARKLKKMRLPHSYAHKIVAETQDVPPGINYNKVVNYNCAQAKRDMAKALETQKKDNYIYNRPTIDPYKIIRIVNTAWPKLFARIEYNKKAISERGVVTIQPRTDAPSHDLRVHYKSGGRAGIRRLNQDHHSSTSQSQDH